MTPAEQRQLTDFYVLIGMMATGGSTVHDRQRLAVMQARAEPRNPPDSRGFRREGP